MKTKETLAVCFAIACVMLCCASCARGQGLVQPVEPEQVEAELEQVDTESKETTDEGVDTPCEVTYSAYEGPYAQLFLHEGDKVAVISPSALPTRAQVDATLEGLRAWGYDPVEGAHVCNDVRTLDDCVADLEWALADPSIKAIFCVRGGYGASEVMDVMTPGPIVSGGKLIVGYSDITAFHSAWTSAGLPSVYASMSGAFMGLPDECAEAERRLLAGEVPTYTCEANAYCKEGEAEGILIGGNLSTFVSVLGTAYDCAKMDEPYIIFLEDVGEDVQHVHRYLTLLEHLGVFERAAGIIFGEWTSVPIDMDDYDGGSRGGAFASMSDMISRQNIAGLEVPVAFSFPAGHGDVNYPLLMGVKVRLEVSDGSFTLSWLG